MDSNTYPKIYHLRSWLVLISAVIFFVLINLGIYFLFHGADEKRPRFHVSASYEEVLAKIEQVKADPNKKIIFLGPSSMWGWGLANISDAAPAQLKKYVLPGVSVYNFSLPAAHTADEFAIVALLKGKADLFITSIVPFFLDNKNDVGVQDDHEKYIRIQSLLQKNYSYLFAQSPAFKKCLSEYGVLPHSDISFDSSRYIPAVRYRTNINEAVLGIEYTLFFDKVLANIIYAVKGQKIDFADLFSSQEKAAMIVPHPSPSSKFNYQTFPSYQPGINSCILQAFATYIVENKAPVIFYTVPEDPALIYKTPSQTKVYQENINFIKKMIKPVKTDLFNMDSINIKTEDFYDQEHFDALGHQEIASGLYQWLKTLPTSSVPSGLFK